MKRLFFIIPLMVGLGTAAAQQYTLDDLISGRFNPRGISEMVSSADGQHYYQTDPRRTAVIKYAYATGEVVDTLLNLATARGAQFNTFEGSW